MKALMLVLAVLLVGASAGAVPASSQEMETVSFAAIAVDGPFDLMTMDGVSWESVSDSEVAMAASEVGVTSLLTVDDSTVLFVGTVSPGVEDLVISSLATMHKNASPTTAPLSVDTHPKQPIAIFHFEKIIITSKGEEKKIFKTISVEKISGESGPEFNKRADRAQSDTIDAGWTSIP